MYFTLSDLLSPLRRQWRLGLGLFCVWAVILLGLLALMPQSEKTTLYYSVIPTQGTEASNHFYAMEGAERAAEMISGWVQDPAFRQRVMDRSGIQIPNFKRKITARKQNRANLFVTLSLPLSLQSQSPTIASAVHDQITADFTTITTQSAAQFQLSTVGRFSEVTEIPIGYLVLGLLLLAAGLSVFCLYVRESIRGTLSYAAQVRALAGNTPVLTASPSTIDHVTAQWAAQHPAGTPAPLPVTLGQTTVSELQNALLLAPPSALILVD